MEAIVEEGTASKVLWMLWTLVRPAREALLYLRLHGSGRAGTVRLQKASTRVLPANDASPQLHTGPLHLAPPVVLVGGWPADGHGSTPVRPCSLVRGDEESFFLDDDGKVRQSSKAPLVKMQPP
ncbi:hypothetical protein C8035_v003678 [Colletotrichum spinosum]|uniref:Uncharacterized protein n=1 Tax=Colletotrichum spinosum TaxID=1347390 RepID=A0A4R8QSC9_9PEZI|nr:hypothetical protein C8035_v003678 [Colletotrichum spinosum]